jgi:hypothetical protein
MVKYLSTLASRARHIHAEIAPCLMRIDNGFMPDKNIQIIEKQLRDMQETLNEMQKLITPPKASNQTRTHSIQASFHGEA